MILATSYPHAPITEAVIDLWVQSRADLNLEELEGVRSGEENTYPHSVKIHLAEGMFTIQEGLPASASTQHQLLGYRFTSDDGKFIWQSRRDGFTFSRLAPYSNWEPFRDEGRRLWRLFRERTLPVAVERLAVRYINRIDIPAQRIDLIRGEDVPSTEEDIWDFFEKLHIRKNEVFEACITDKTRRLFE